MNEQQQLAVALVAAQVSASPRGPACLSGLLVSSYESSGGGQWQRDRNENLERHLEGASASACSSWQQTEKDGHLNDWNSLFSCRPID